MEEVGLPPATSSEKSLRLRDEEWVLLLDLYLRRRPASVTANDPELIELSSLLGATGSTQHPNHQARSPDGLRGRVNVFRSLDPDIATDANRTARGAVRAWGLYGHNSALCRDEAERIKAKLSRPRSHNPDWSWDETVLALRTFLRLRTRYASPTGQDVKELSRTLRDLSAEEAGRAPTFRNPAGVARKINKFNAAKSGEGPTRVRGAKLEMVVWRRFHDDLEGLERVAAAIVEPATADPETPSPSRGPGPSFGPRFSNRDDGETRLYVMRLRGPVDQLFPDHTAAGLSIIKVGRSNDTDRRLSELNSGFPPRCGLAWELVDHQTYGSALTAHTAEQWILSKLFSRGLTLGGEFACCPATELSSVLRHPRLLAFDQPGLLPS